MNNPLFWTAAVGLVYFFIGIGFLLFNLWLFERFTEFSVKDMIFETQSDALSYVVKGQLIAISIMISALIYYTGHTPEFNTKEIMPLVYSLETTFWLGIVGSFLLQATTAIVARFSEFEKEIILQENTALGRIIEGILIALSLLISISFFAY